MEKSRTTDPHDGFFADLIAQGHSMIRRLQRLVGLAYQERVAIPGEEQVPWREVLEWKNTATQRVHDAFDGRADARLELAYELHREAVHREEGDEVDRMLTYCQRVVSILQELEEI